MKIPIIATMYLVRNLIFCSALVAFPLLLSGQITDNFSDGDFNANPVWSGDAPNFVVNSSGQLQLMAPAAGASSLYVPGNIPDSAVWLMYVKLDFAPSTSNLLRIYLQSDQSDLLAGSGYLLEMGETGSLDALRLMRQDAGVRTLLASGIAGGVAGEPVEVKIKVKRTAAGNWTVEMAAGAGNFALQCTAADNTYQGAANSFFGVYCLYTATRTDKFYFDDIDIQPDLPDTAPPVLVSAQAIDATHVTAVFNEPLDSLSAVNAANYNVIGVGAAAGAVLQADKRSVTLNLSNTLATGNYQLQTVNIADLIGNVSGTQTAAFNYLLIETAAEFDVLINEIMADPSPSAGLPDVEWLEIYNRSDKVIDLKTLRLSDGGVPAALPDQLLLPDAYAVLCTSSGAVTLGAVAPGVYGVSGFPGLNNDGETLTLSLADGTLIDQVAFSINWHTDFVKRDGGWTLERINPTAPCVGAANWQSCPVVPGGTPGLANAALSTTPDTEGPALLSVFPLDAFTLRLVFSEGLDVSSATNTSAYQFTPVLSVTSAQSVPGNRAEVLLYLGAALTPSQVYAISPGAQLTDCSGNAAITTDTLRFGLAETPAPHDVVINEVLFNPATGGTRFVELYNRSNKLFTWEQFFVANFHDGADIEPVGLQRLFLPGEYIVLTENTADIITRFADTRPDWVLDANLPSLSDTEDNITLYWSDNGVSITLDSLDYFDDWHNAFYTSSDREGVSLERIRPEGPTNDPSNWTSAAGPAGGPAGTPTRPNSQQATPLQPGQDLLTLTRERLSPDADGYEDFLEMQYTLPATGYAASVTVFDAGGAPVKHLVRQDLLGTEGILRWDGDADDGTRLRPGIYVVFAEFFEPGGDVQHVKKAVALVGRF